MDHFKHHKSLAITFFIRCAQAREIRPVYVDNRDTSRVEQSVELNRTDDSLQFDVLPSHNNLFILYE
jgi:hypothetical protein